MSTLITALLAALPSAFIAVFSRLLTEKFLQEVLQTVIVYGIQKLAPLTTNTLDDELVKKIIEQIEAKK